MNAMPHSWRLSLPGCALLALAPALVYQAVQLGVGPPPLPWRIGGEMLSALLAALVFINGCQAMLSGRRPALMMLGMVFLGVAAFDAAASMGAVVVAGAPPMLSAGAARQLELGARTLAAVSLLAYVLLPPAALSPTGLPGMGGQGPEPAPAAATPPNGRAADQHSWLYWLPWVPPALLLLSLIMLLMSLVLPRAASIASDVQWLLVVLHVLALPVLWACRRRLRHASAPSLALALGLSAAALSAGACATDINADNALHGLALAYRCAAGLYLFHAISTEALRRPVELLRARHVRETVTMNAAPDGVLWVDENGIMRLTNPAMAALSGYSKEELLGQHVNLLLPPSERPGHAAMMTAYFKAPRARAMGQVNLQLRRRDGTMLPIDITLGEWQDDGVCYAIAYVRDLRERRAFEQSLQHQATHDDLTGLPNRRLFHLQLNHAVARAQRQRERIAVLFLDLDHFKVINDSFGHAAGDALLREAGNRIRSALRGSDVLARLGGDEFAVLLSGLQRPDEAMAVADKLQQALQSVYQLTQQDVYSGASIGIAFLPDDAGDSDTLLRFADMAMYQAKRGGRGAYACYSHELNARAHEDMRLHTRLKEALANDRLQLHFQPQIDVIDGTVRGAEALLRWYDADLGQVPPSRFIPVAEASGLILALSNWVLERSCEQIAAWHRAGTPLRVAVNFSALQFGQRGLAEQVEAVLRRTGAPARLLDIEITETVAMSHPERAREQIASLVALGCSVALDDFGTGYSSLAYLKDLPVGKLKIDRSFVAGLPGNSGDCTIAQAIIGLAHSFGMTLVAEGVETPAQLNFLDAQGCEMYQGWLYAKAMPAAELSAILEAARDGCCEVVE